MLAAVVVLMMLPTFDPAVLTIPTDPKAVWIEQLAQCESGGRADIKILDTDGYYSYGMFQFHLRTWLDFGTAFGTTKENIYDGELQRKVVRAMLDDGLWRHWYTCGKRITNALGEYPW